MIKLSALTTHWLTSTILAAFIILTISKTLWLLWSLIWILIRALNWSLVRLLIWALIWTLDWSLIWLLIGTLIWSLDRSLVWLLVWSLNWWSIIGIWWSIIGIRHRWSWLLRKWLLWAIDWHIWVRINWLLQNWHCGHHHPGTEGAHCIHDWIHNIRITDTWCVINWCHRLICWETVDKHFILLIIIADLTIILKALIVLLPRGWTSECHQWQ